jgi:squalene cyclase
MGREATKTLPVKPETKNLVDEQKPDGVTYDYWVRKQLGVEE